MAKRTLKVSEALEIHSAISANLKRDVEGAFGFDLVLIQMSLATVKAAFDEAHRGLFTKYGVKRVVKVNDVDVEELAPATIDGKEKPGTAMIDPAWEEQYRAELTPILDATHEFELPAIKIHTLKRERLPIAFVKALQPLIDQ